MQPHQIFAAGANDAELQRRRPPGIARLCPRVSFFAIGVGHGADTFNGSS